MIKTKLIAYYLPQFHPIPENDKWWGNGFTEWTNVGKAKKLFVGHDQPKVPSYLGYYDLRIPEVRELQTTLAREAGIDAFCYWHYYFGNGKRLLETPLNEIIKLKKPNFPFCLAWANHSWQDKTWKTNYENKNHSTLLIEQLYPGKKDIDLHFYTMLDAFKDERYYKIHDKLVFVIYRPLEVPELNYFIERWQELAYKNNLSGFFFVGHSMNPSEIRLLKNFKLDAINLSLHHQPFNRNKNYIHKLKRYIQTKYLKMPDIVNYSSAIKKMKSPIFSEERIYPTIVPNWDNTPRSGYYGRVFKNCTPDLFGKHIDDVLELIKNKDTENRVIFIKSWNEWAEGNYLEPDIKNGTGFIDMLRKKIMEE